MPHSEVLWHIEITSRAPHGALTSVFYSLIFFFTHVMDFVKQEAVLIVYHASKFLGHENIHEHMMAFPLH